MAWYEEGEDPDYRFSLANERTFLAWIRTALALLAVAVILRQFFSSASMHERSLFYLSVVLAVLAGIVGVGAFFRWRTNEHAMRLARPLPVSMLIFWLAIAMGVLGASLAVWLLMGL